MVKDLDNVNLDQPLKVLSFMTKWIDVLLVSGTVGFQGLASIALGDLSLGVQQFFQMFVVAVTILAGIMIGNTIMRPRQGL